MSSNTTHTNDITVRLADYSDARRLARLATLDSARLPDGPLVVAESDGQIVAALPLEGGRAIADPFHRTVALVQMLELRAAQLRGATSVRRSWIAEHLRPRLTAARPQPRLQ
jgi:hypothetical protein